MSHINELLANATQEAFALQGTIEALQAERDALRAALERIAASEEYHGDMVVCDFSTLQSVARAALAGNGGAS